MNNLDINTNIYNRYKTMSFKELKHILKDDNHKKTKTEEYIIRKIMKEKYDKYKKYKELHEVNINTNNIQELDELCLELESNNYKKPDKIHIDRLSNDLDIQNIYKNKNKNKKNIVSPYSDLSNNFGSYAPCI